MADKKSGLLYRAAAKKSSITTTDSFVQNLVVEVLGTVTKGVIVRETGGANGLTYKIEGSIDQDGDIGSVPANLITVQGSTAVAASAQSAHITYTPPLKLLAISTKSTATGLAATAEIEVLCE